ncbi:hypothetical protein VTL71DRAFT_10474 [Oculimacula yallundae]|uniref:Uncharacterized protein n=1 Tax=Oculimacula yallundae TaxID=86028 RepID=A0ABR4CTH0_9HELO
MGKIIKDVKPNSRTIRASAVDRPEISILISNLVPLPPCPRPSIFVSPPPLFSSSSSDLLPSSLSASAYSCRYTYLCSLRNFPWTTKRNIGTDSRLFSYEVTASPISSSHLSSGSRILGRLGPSFLIDYLALPTT